MNGVQSDAQQDERRHDSAAGCLARIFWMMLGNLILVISSLGILEGPSVGLTGSDVVYWLTVGALLGVRYADIRYLDGRKADGEPATMSDWRRYTGMLVGGALVAWIALHAAAGLDF